MIQNLRSFIKIGMKCRYPMGDSVGGEPKQDLWGFLTQFGPGCLSSLLG
jgi:hypothetical protein